MDWIRNRLAQYNARTAFHEANASISYGELIQRIDFFQETLKKRLRKGLEVVAIQETRTSENLAAILALAAMGKTALPLDPSTPDKEQQMQISGAEWTLRNSEVFQENEPGSLHPLLKKLADSENPGLILFSSGTTGRPKGMVHDLKLLLNRYQKVIPRKDITLQLLPIDHIGGLDAALRALCSGSTLVIPKARTPEAVGEAIAKHKVNVLPASPTFLNLMLLAGVPDAHDTSSLTVIAYGAEPMPPSLLKKLSCTFPDTDLQQKFGTSETGAVRIKSSKNGSLGFSFADSDIQWKVVDDELWIQSPSRILGYLNDEADNSSLLPDGWFRTGDLVEKANDGFLRIIGRRQDLINVGGEKVTPAEVESVVMEMPQVADCLVYGEENAITGQNVAAEVVTKAVVTDSGELKRSIKKYCRERLAAYKVPARIVVAHTTEYSDRFKKLRRQRGTEDDSR